MRSAIILLAKGQISKAAKRINSTVIANIEDTTILVQMRKKYPDRGRPLPPSVTTGQCMYNLAGLRDVLLSIKGGVSPGTGGMRNEYLTCLAEIWEEAEMGLLEHT